MRQYDSKLPTRVGIAYRLIIIAHRLDCIDKARESWECSECRLQHRKLARQRKARSAEHNVPPRAAADDASRRDGRRRDRSRQITIERPRCTNWSKDGLAEKWAQTRRRLLATSTRVPREDLSNINASQVREHLRMATRTCRASLMATRSYSRTYLQVSRNSGNFTAKRTSECPTRTAPWWVLRCGIPYAEHARRR